jgi:hypothetical protein
VKIRRAAAAAAAAADKWFIQPSSRQFTQADVIVFLLCTHQLCFTFIPRNERRFQLAFG